MAVEITVSGKKREFTKGLHKEPIDGAEVVK